MGLFARFTCLRRSGTPQDLAAVVRDLLKTRNMVETADAAERLVMIAPAGDGWIMVVDHAEDLSAAMADGDGLLTELANAPDAEALDIMVADSDYLVLSLIEGGTQQCSLVVGHRGIEEGTLEPWHHLLAPGQSIEAMRDAFSKRTVFVEEHLPAFAALFGIDLAALNDTVNLADAKPPRAGCVLMRLKAVPAAGQIIGAPRLEADHVHLKNLTRNNSIPQVPVGLVTRFPGFSFHGRGGTARGLEVLLTGSSLSEGLIEIVSAELSQCDPMSTGLNLRGKAVPEKTSAGLLLRFDDIEVPDWLEPDRTKGVPMGRSRHDFLVFVTARAEKVGEGELDADARLLAPPSPPERISFPVTVLPAMWRPLRSNEQPNQLRTIRQLNSPTRINVLAVLRGGAEEGVSALRKALDTWRSLIEPEHHFTVAAAKELAYPGAFFSPVHSVTKQFDLDPAAKRQTKWDRLMADLSSVQGLRITSQIAWNIPADQREAWHARRVGLQYTSAAAYSDLRDYAARLGHISLSLPASPGIQQAVVSLIQTLAAEGLIGQAFVANWDGDDEPNGTTYESATDNFMHQKTARGWGTRYLRAVADRLWLGPEFAGMLPDRAALERVAVVSEVGETLAIERRPETTLRDLELCLAPMLPTAAEARAFGERIFPPGQ